MFGDSSIVFPFDINPNRIVALDGDFQQVGPTTNRAILGELLHACAATVHENAVFFAAKRAVVRVLGVDSKFVHHF